jgi:hypothetical protein
LIEGEINELIIGDEEEFDRLTTGNKEVVMFFDSLVRIMMTRSKHRIFK